jgi:hypothetical protein
MFVDREKSGVLLFALVAAFLLAGVGAADAQMYWGTRPIGMGGAFTAVANDVDAIEWNPAGLTTLTKNKQMGFDINYEYHQYLFGDFPYLQPQLIQKTSSNEFGNGYFNNTTPTAPANKKFSEDWYHLAIADGYVNPLVAVGAAFTTQDPSNQLFKHGTDFQADLSAAGGFANIVNFGGTARWVNFDPTGKGKFDFDVGMLINAINLIKVGLTGRNLLGNDEPLVVRREVALGVAGYVMDYATVSLEVTKVFDGLKKLNGPLYQPKGTFVFAAGAEGVIVKLLSLRGGFNYDEISGARMYSVGLGFVDKHGTIGYSFQGSVDHVRDFTHSIQLVIYYP